MRCIRHIVCVHPNVPSTRQASSAHPRGQGVSPQCTPRFDPTGLGCFNIVMSAVWLQEPRQFNPQCGLNEPVKSKRKSYTLLKDLVKLNV